MSPNQSFLLNHVPMEPMSRTYQYRKIMKPLLERKRRARINKCLDELKALLASAMQSEGDNVAKLEKADILELTVRHLHNLRQKNALHLRQDRVKTDSFWDGFRQCAAEVSHYLSKYDPKVGAEVMKHINRCAQADPARTQRQTISLRPDAYLFGTFRYDNQTVKQTPVVRQETSIPPPPRIVEIIEIDDSVSVWRPW